MKLLDGSHCTCLEEDLPETRIPQDLVILLRHIRNFWRDGAVGWSPPEAEDSLQRIDFDNLVDLAEEFPNWYAGENRSRGQFVLAWVALGAVAEGGLQWFFSVYKDDYLRDPLFKDRTKEKITPPEDIFFAKLIRYFKEHIWLGGPDTPGPQRMQTYTSSLNLIRIRRNCIHSVKSELGSWDEWKMCLHCILILLCELEGRVPYPHEGFEYPSDAADVILRHLLITKGEKPWVPGGGQ